MTQSLNSAKPALSRRFRLQWILGHALGYGVVAGLPYLVADGVFAVTYPTAFAIAFLSSGLLIGFIQQRVLRRVVPVSARWAVWVGFTPVLSILPFLIMRPFIGPLSALLSLIAYPLILTAIQWRFLQQRFRSAGWWMVTGLSAIALGLTISLLIARVLQSTLTPQLGITVAISALIYGYLYGVITYVGLRRFIKTDRLRPVPEKQSVSADPPVTGAWKLFFLSTGLLCGLFIIWFSVLPPLSASALARFRALPSELLLVVMLASMLGYIYLTVLVHEMGHLLLALAYGFDLRAFAVNRWMLIRHGKKWQFRHAKKPFAGGFVLPVAKSFDAFNKRSLMMMLWGGTLGTLLLFIVGASPLLFLRSAVSDSLFLWSVAGLSVFSLHSTLLNIFPLAIGPMRTDGRRLLDLEKGNLQGQSFFSLYGIGASLRQGIRPRALSRELIEKVLSAPEKSMVHLDGLFTAYTAAIDSGELEQAGHYLDQALEHQDHMPVLFRGKTFAEGAYFESTIRGRADVARELFEKIQDTTFIFPATLLRVEAAVLLAEGNRQAALAKAEAGMVSVGRDRFMKGTAVAEEDFLQALIQKIKAS